MSNDRTPQSTGESQSIDAQQYLTFSLQKELFAMNILRILEIREFGRITPVPMMPEFIRGVINVRGAVVPVVDLSVRFNGKASQPTKRSCIIIIETNGPQGMQDIGILVDSVSEVMDIPASEIEPAPAFGARIRSDFIEGMGKIHGDFVIILSVDKVLSVEELSILNSAKDLALDKLQS